MLLQVIKVAGSSLHPLYQDGDYVLISRIPILLFGIRPGDVVVYQHSRHDKRIKIVERLENQGQSVFVVGLSSDSIDSRAFGAIPRRVILGKVFAHIPKKRVKNRFA